MPPKPEPEAPYTGPIMWHRDEDWRDGVRDGAHSGKFGGTLDVARGKRMPSGFHHIALVCKDMEEQIKFYEVRRCFVVVV